MAQSETHKGRKPEQAACVFLGLDAFACCFARSVANEFPAQKKCQNIDKTGRIWYYYENEFSGIPA